MSLHADALRVLTEWPAPGQEALRQGFLGFLAARHDAMARSCVPGHLTASTVVLSASGDEVLLTLHPRVGRWLQLGGHCESDGSLAAAALREATEESGIPALVVDPVPVRLDIHPITCSLGVPTRHFDVQYVAVAPEGAVAVASSESTDLRWWPVDALPEGTDVAPLVEAAVRRLRGYIAR